MENDDPEAPLEFSRNDTLRKGLTRGKAALLGTEDQLPMRPATAKGLEDSTILLTMSHPGPSFSLCDNHH